MASLLSRKKPSLESLYNSCFVCEGSGYGRMRLTKHDYKNLKPCRLFQVMRARKPLCKTCRVILGRCANTLRSYLKKPFPRYFWRRIAEFQFCIVCGRQNLLLSMEFERKSIKKLILRELIHQDIEIYSQEDICCYCSLTICDLVIFFVRELLEKGVDRTKYNETAAGLPLPE